jgi:hypothetical protein
MTDAYNRYVQHIWDQVTAVLQSQRIGVIYGTARLLEMLPEFVDARLLKDVRGVVHAGTTMPVQSHKLLREDVFPKGKTCRRELLDRTLIWNQLHLLHALREFEQFYNAHRPHQGIANTRPLHPLPGPITAPDRQARLDVRRRDRLGGILHEYQHAA